MTQPRSHDDDAMIERMMKDSDATLDAMLDATLDAMRDVYATPTPPRCDDGCGRRVIVEGTACDPCVLRARRIEHMLRARPTRTHAHDDTGAPITFGRRL